MAYEHLEFGSGSSMSKSEMVMERLVGPTVASAREKGLIGEVSGPAEDVLNSISTALVNESLGDEYDQLRLAMGGLAKIWNSQELQSEALFSFGLRLYEDEDGSIKAEHIV